MASYSLAKTAGEDIRRLYRFGVEHFGLDQADRYYDGLFERFDEIAAAPKLYMAVDHISPGYRRSIYGAHSIYYIMHEDDIRIMRILYREDPNLL